MNYVILICIIVVILMLLYAIYQYFSKLSSINNKISRKTLAYENTLFSTDTQIEHFNPSTYSQYSWVSNQNYAKVVLITPENPEGVISDEITFVNNTYLEGINNVISVQAAEGVTIDWNGYSGTDVINPQYGFVFLRVDINVWVFFQRFEIYSS